MQPFFSGTKQRLRREEFFDGIYRTDGIEAGKFFDRINRIYRMGSVFIFGKFQFRDLPRRSFSTKAGTDWNFPKMKPLTLTAPRNIIS